MPTTAADRERKRRILRALNERSLLQAAADTKVRTDLEAEANSDAPKKLVTRDMLDIADARRQAPEQNGLAFFSSADVIIVPGFMGSELADETPNGKGLIWLDPGFVLDGTGELLDLRLGAGDADPDGVRVRPRGAVPLVYGGLKYALEFSGYDVRIFGFDWRKHIDASAAPLAELIRARTAARPRPLHLIAHSQGSLVARRALQMLGPEVARRVVNSLVLLGPATAGTFSAAFALAGSHDLLDTAARWGLAPPDDFAAVLQSMTGLYQLLPWRTAAVNGTATDKSLEWVAATQNAFKTAAFWKPLKFDADAERRLTDYYGWGNSIDSGFMNDRTTVILGDAPTVGGVKLDGTRLIPDDDFKTTGDGTVPDAFARVPGVTRVFKAAGAEHMMLPATWAVVMAVRAVLGDRQPRLEPFKLGADAQAAPFLDRPQEDPAEFFGVAKKPSKKTALAPAADRKPEAPPPAPPQIADVSPPAVRRLRVFSFDPLFAGELENIGIEQVTIELPWTFADGDQLQPGPVGEYLEVVDFDASSRCFYPPVDLNHPHVLAQDGIPVSEGDPRFHQQMVYAVAMNTIRQFEVALGRAALWAPNLPRNRYGEVELPKNHRTGDEYVGRLRIYPHAMRQRNAYYSPPKKALLMGYFPAEAVDVGRNLPGGMIFSSLSYDIIAHETTHALLDGLHRYFVQPSNPDVFAFHEAFADLVALFQHFSHPEVLRRQVAKARGDLGGETALGVLAAQFGEASGQRAALREYLGRVKKDPKTGAPVLDALGRRQWEPVLPDPTLIRTTTESHARGAILVAAMFRAFLNIYELRVADLRRIATGGTGRLAEGELHPALVDRMANEAAKAARHMLRMCVRALDYVPPVDVTFGEYLRALITADYDLVRNDDRAYRMAVVNAFREWGIYPEGVRSLSVDSLLWDPAGWQEYSGPRLRHPDASQQKGLAGLRDFFAKFPCPCQEWGTQTDRRAAYLRMNEQAAAFHGWLSDPKNMPPELAGELGLRLDPDPKKTPRGIRRDKDGNGKPTFSVHSFRPCRRIGPDGQELTDVVVEVVQRRLAYFNEDAQRDADDPTKKPFTRAEYQEAAPDFHFRGGCTLIIDPTAGVVRYCIRKSIGDLPRLARERSYRRGGGLGGSYLAPPSGDNPFAALHAGCDHC